jgi:hypothetical protein
MLGRMTIDGVAGSTTQIDPVSRADLALGGTSATVESHTHAVTGLVKSQPLPMELPPHIHEKAKVIAYGKVCMTADGRVDKESRVFRADIGDTSSENSEMAIRSVCRKVDVTGVEVVDIKRISEGGRFRSYVLVALPMGDANILRKGKVDEEIRKGSAKRADEMFNKMDKQNEVNSPVN